MPTIRRNKDALVKANALRQSQPLTEKLLWSKLRDRRLAGYKFRRQATIGPYVTDFLCSEQSLAVELDGGQHTEQTAYDKARDAYMKKLGYRVLRFWNSDMQNIDSVLETILHHLQNPHPNPLP